MKPPPVRRLPAPRAIVHLLYWHLPRLVGGRLPLAFLAAGAWLAVTAPRSPWLVAMTALVAFLAYCGRSPGIPFVRSVVGAEFAPQLLVGQLVTILLAWASHGPALLTAGTSRERAFAWGLHALWAFNVVALGRSARDVLRARSLARSALGAAGVPIDGAVGAPLAPSLWATLVYPWSALVVPGVRCDRELTFATVDGTPLRCDVYRPEAVTDATPVVLFLHGGGWVLGDREIYFPTTLARRLAGLGCLVVTSDYRLAPEAAFPAQVVDCKRAIAWIRSDAFPYGGRRAALVVGGESAGGNVALVAALTGNDPALQPPECPDADTRVAACIDLFGIHSILDIDYVPPARQKTHWKFCEDWLVQVAYRPDDPDSLAAFERASPARLLPRLTTAAPPIFSIHGMLDLTVPYRDALIFQEALAQHRTAHPATGVRDAFLPLPGTGHAFCMWPGVRSLAVADAVARYVAQVTATAPRPR